MILFSIYFSKGLEQMIKIRLRDKKLHINEISQSELNKLHSVYSQNAEYIKKRHAKNHIFGSRKRILLPFKTFGSITNTSDYPYNCRSFFSIVSNSGYVLDLQNKIIKSDKFPNGLRIMKFIDRILAGKEGDLAKFFRDGPDLDRVKIDLEKFWTESSKDELCYIATRFPLDVIRMSDFSGINSCHSIDGDYYTCAVQESLGYGFVVFGVVNNKQITQEWLDQREQQEIFFDKQRGLVGLLPVVRTRCRQFSVEIAATDLKENNDSDDYFFLYTREDREYGNSNHGKQLASNILTWLQTVQRKQIELITSKLEAPEKYHVIFQRAVTYSDTDDEFALQELLGVSRAEMRLASVLSPQESDADLSAMLGNTISEDELQYNINTVRQSWHRRNHDSFRLIITYDISEDGEGNEYYNLNCFYSFNLIDVIRLINERREERNLEQFPTETLLYFIKKIDEDKLKDKISKIMSSNGCDDIYDSNLSGFDFEFNGNIPVHDSFDVEAVYSVDLLDTYSFVRDLHDLFEDFMKKVNPDNKFTPEPEEQTSFDFYPKTVTKDFQLENKKTQIHLRLKIKQ